MKVSEVMTSDVQFINKSKTLQEAARLMQEKHIGAIPVEDNNKLVGMLTDRDIALIFATKGPQTEGLSVSECMSKGIKYCFEDEDASEVSSQMSKLNVRRMPVMSRDKKLVGIVTFNKLINAKAPKIKNNK